jgi:hypothetical protein
MIEASRENIEVAHHLNRAGHLSSRRDSRFDEVIEIVEAIVLALVAVATAWSGYQAARWDNRRAELYGESSRLRVTAEGLATLGGQERIYDTTTFNSWLDAFSRGDQKLAHLFERRFREEYRVAFGAWMKTDPLENPQAPPGPQFMDEYKNSKTEQAGTLVNRAAATFDQGTAAGTTGDSYVRITVLLATVLLLTAISQRFRVVAVRMGLLVTAFAVLTVPVWSLLTLPRI